MPPVLYDYLFGIIRTLLAVALEPLIKWGLANQEQTTQVVAWLAGVVLIVGWSLYQKYAAKRVTLTALTMPVGTTESEVNAKIASGVAVPSVLTAANETPIPK